MGENITNVQNIFENISQNGTDINLEQNETNFNYTLWIIALYFSALIIGILINLLLIISLIQQKKHGTMYLILQFCLIDLISTWVASTEIWSIYVSDWQFYPTLCPIFLGSEVLINVITVYMHILLNFHAISAWNMQKNIEMTNKNPLTSDRDESNECLMWSEPSAPNRTINIDYRYKRTSVSILLPSMLLWFGCISLSIPEFTLSTTVDYHNQTLCTIVDLHYTQILQLLLILFRGIIPIPLLFLTFVIVIFKLCNSTSLSDVKKNSSAKKFNELKTLLLLSLVLSLLYILLSFQRSIFNILHITSQHFTTISLNNFKMPPLDNFILTNYTNMYLSMLHYASIIVRPILIIYVMPSTLSIFKKCIVKSAENTT